METDIAIIGGGVLGVTTAYWLSEIYDCSITTVERDTQIAHQTTMRNTGVIHRPYYLNPSKRKVFAISAGRSYVMWKKLATKSGLPWKEYGTLMLATEEGQLDELKNYGRWAAENGMGDEEYELLDREQVKSLEPEVECRGAFLSKTDTSTDFAALTKAVWSIAAANGVRLLPSAEVKKVERKPGGLELAFGDGRKLACSLLVNVAGGGSLDIAHLMGLAREYTDLHFRGEYWVVNQKVAPRVARNIYSVAKHAEFNFLDPHFIIRADGRKEVGPNAVLVAGPDTYSGAGPIPKILGKMFEKPILPKFRLFGNATFLSLVADEWMSSLSKGAMCNRVKQFVPRLEESMLTGRGLAGVRSSVIGNEGFVPEAIVVNDAASIHVLNYNSPGATGAPAFAAYMVDKAREDGQLDRFKTKVEKSTIWEFDPTKAFFGQ